MTVIYRVTAKDRAVIYMFDCNLFLFSLCNFVEDLVLIDLSIK